MNRQNQPPNPLELISNFLAQAPQIMEAVQEMNENLQKFIERSESNNEGEFEGFITEEKAKKILGKEKSWFSEKRKSGELRFTKVGGTVWYQKDDILQMFHTAFNK